MILHLLEDEKVINRTIELFEKANKGNNKFLIEIPNDGYRLKYVQPSQGTVVAVFGSETYWKTVGDASKYQAIILHRLTKNKCRFIDKFKNLNIPFLWILWGTDLYSYLAGIKGYKLYLWKPSFLNLSVRWKYVDKLNMLIRNIGTALVREQSFKSLFESAYKRIDYCGTFNKGDYELLLKYTDSSASWLWFNYYPIDTILGEDLINKKISGENIIVNNSASITGNHIPAFDLLSTLDLKNKKIIVPLSYGDEKYAELVVKEGKRILGESFIPVRNFMSLKEYNNLLCSASIVIMYQLRQEAVGNILISLYLGAKVYLHEENNLFDYFSSIGVKIFSIKKDLKPDNPEAFRALSEEDQLLNREKMLAEFNEERVISKTKMLLQEVSN